MVRTMTDILMVMICLLGYITVIIGTIFVIDIGAREILGIDVLAKTKRRRR